MKRNLPVHLSSSIDIDTSTRPIEFFDRISKFKMIRGVFIGVIVSIISPVISYFSESGTSVSLMSDETYNEAPDETFLYILPVIGLFFVVANIVTFFQKRKIIIGHRYITIYRTNLKTPTEVFMESISNYIGVRYRTRIFRYGFLATTQHVIELLHEDSKKTIPIYIGSKVKGIRQKWAKTAKDFNLPAVARTADGFKVLSCEDLQKPIKNLILEEKLEHSFDEAEKTPKIFSLKTEGMKKIVIINKIIKEFGVFIIILTATILSTALLLSLSRLSVFADYSFVAQKIIVPFAFFVIAFLPLVMVLRRRGVIIEKDKIYTIIKLPLFSFKTACFEKDKINAVDVIYRDTENTYFVAVTSGDKTVHLGKGSDVLSLKWLKSIIIEDIMRAEVKG